MKWQGTPPSECPICGDNISGFHYGIFSCEGCKQFFKRCVQKNCDYQCQYSNTCDVKVETRKNALPVGLTNVSIEA